VNKDVTLEGSPVNSLGWWATTLQQSICNQLGQRTKPILDAYTGPYKDRYRFWPGLLLLVRIFLLVAFAGNVSGDPSLNLVVVQVTVCSAFSVVHSGPSMVSTNSGHWTSLSLSFS